VKQKTGYPFFEEEEEREKNHKRESKEKMKPTRGVKSCQTEQIIRELLESKSSGFVQRRDCCTVPQSLNSADEINQISGWENTAV
jgi:hypothetical protein